MLWRQILRQNFTCYKKLFEFLELDSEALPQVLKKPDFPLNLPLRLAQKIEKNNLEDPILKQFLPTVLELKDKKGFSLDPVKDETFRKENKLLHKYQGRALLVCTSACPMNCRYCFRKNFPYDTEDKLFMDELKAIQNDPSLSEVILSGGDPLSLSNDSLENLLKSLSTIPHVKRIRFHTRYPIGIPERIDEGFIKLLQETSAQIIFIIQCNHPKELDTEIFFHLKKLQSLSIPLFTHTVLLKGINDSISVLKELFETLVNHGIIPYYLNQLDKVQGSSHFEVPTKKGLALMKELRSHLPGYAMPTYVQEIAGEPHKTPLYGSSIVITPLKSKAKQKKFTSALRKINKKYENALKNLAK